MISELTRERMLVGMQYRFSPEARAAFAEYVALRRAQPNFANARSIRRPARLDKV